MFHVKHFRRPFVGKNCTVDTGTLRNTPVWSGDPQPRPLLTRRHPQKSISNTFAANTLIFHRAKTPEEKRGIDRRRRSELSTGLISTREAISLLSPVGSS